MFFTCQPLSIRVKPSLNNAMFPINDTSIGYINMNDTVSLLTMNNESEQFDMTVMENTTAFARSDDGICSVRLSPSSLLITLQTPSKEEYYAFASTMGVSSLKVFPLNQEKLLYIVVLFGGMTASIGFFHTVDHSLFVNPVPTTVRWSTVDYSPEHQILCVAALGTSSITLLIRWLGESVACSRRSFARVSGEFHCRSVAYHRPLRRSLPADRVKWDPPFSHTQPHGRATSISRIFRILHPKRV